MVEEVAEDSVPMPAKEADIILAEQVRQVIGPFITSLLVSNFYGKAS